VNRVSIHPSPSGGAARRARGLAALLLLSGLMISHAAPAQNESEYAIEPVKDNVYRFSAGPYHSAFMVTDAGIFVTDPINRDAARWLRDTLAERFDRPIRYLAYSHNHVDHVLGGEEFADAGAQVIAHTLADEDLRLTRAPTAYADLTFDDTLTVTLGNSRVEFRYYGANNGRGSVSMRFMPANVLFVVDWIVLGRMPYKTLPGYDIQGMMRSTRAVLDEPAFDCFVGGHAAMGSRDDVARYLSYLEALYAAVRDGMLAGRSLSELKADIRLDAFADLAQYEAWLPENIEGVHHTLNDMSYFDRRPDISR
jgi:glyoxylase-like metal-dependent hydrolase (beta-lactamase superfamily II)